MIALELLAAGVALGVFGAHALLPWRLASADEPARRRWALLAPPLLAAGIVAALLALALRPDEALAWGLTHPLRGSTAARAIAVVVAALVAADLFLFFAWQRFEAEVWRALAAIGALALVGQSFGAELLRTGEGPWRSSAALLLAALLRVPLALAAAEAATAPRARWALVAAPALALMPFCWPLAVRSALGRDVATLAAAVLLLAGARFVPPSLRRATAAAGLVLALLFLARTAELSRTLGVRQELHEFELAPR